MESFAKREENSHSPEKAAVNFFLTHKQFFLDTLEMSLLAVPKKKKLIEFFDKFLDDLKNPDIVQRTMVAFDDQNNIHRVAGEDGVYDIYVATHVLFGSDYLGGELLSLLSEQRNECREVYKMLKEGFENFSDN